MFLKDICKIFNKHKVKYLIIGGDAAVYYGAEDVSIDYDLWIETTENNFKKVIKALMELGYCDNSDFNFGQKTYKRWQAFTLGNIIRFQKAGEKPIDIITRLKYKKFINCYERINKGLSSDGIVMPWVSKKDLKFLKKTAGREKDIRALKQIKEKERKKQ